MCNHLTGISWQNPVYGSFEIIPHVSLFSHALCMHYVIIVESAVDRVMSVGLLCMPLERWTTS